MKYPRSKALISVLLSSLLLITPAYAEPLVADNPDIDTHPTTITMAADALIARPLLLLTTAAGVMVFVISLPFSALGNNVHEAAEKLVMVPARATFTRCLGCVQQKS
jgi:hypothetical protein